MSRATSSMGSQARRRFEVFGTPVGDLVALAPLLARDVRDGMELHHTSPPSYLSIASAKRER
jgi:hypothetical protein